MMPGKKSHRGNERFDQTQRRAKTFSAAARTSAHNISFDSGSIVPSICTAWITVDTTTTRTSDACDLPPETSLVLM